MKNPPLSTASVFVLAVVFLMPAAFAFDGRLALQNSNNWQGNHHHHGGNVSITISPTSSSVQVGNSKQFSATVSGTSYTGVNWLVNGVAGGNSAVGTVSPSGLYSAPTTVPAVAVTVTAQCSAYTYVSASANVTITNITQAPVTVSISPTSDSLQVGQSQQFSASVSGTTNTSVSWLVNGFSGGNSTVGMVSSSGLYTAPASAPASTITVTAQSVAQPSASASASVSVTAPPPPVTVSISPTSDSLQVGQSQQFSASVTGTTNTSVNWLVNGFSSGNATVGTVSSSGLYTAPSTRPASTITVTAQSVAQPSASASASVSVTAPPPPVTVSISPTSDSLQTGQSQQFTASVSGTSNTAVTWLVNGFSGGSSTVGMVSSSGLYTAPSAAPNGAITVTAQSVAQPSASASASVSVTAPPPPVTVSISPTSDSLQVGQSQQFSASVSGTSNTAVTWLVNGSSGGNATVGMVSSSGLYTAPSAAPNGAITVTAQSVAQPSASASASVSVTAPPPPVTVSISPTSDSLQTGQSQQFSASVSGSSNTAVTWLVNGSTGGNSTVGTVSSSGLYTAPSAAPGGAISVTAQSVAQPSASASASISVTAPPPVTVSVSPTTSSVRVSQTQQFTASVSGSSNTAVSWMVNGTAGGNATVGTVSSSGMYTAPANVPSGSVTVTAQSVAQPTSNANASVSVMPAIVSVTISPTSASVQVDQSQQFSASVSGTSNTGVNWFVAGIFGGNSTVGTISSSGLYTAPANAPSGQVTVTAQSAYQTSSTASAGVTITAPSPSMVNLSWSPSTSSVAGYNVYRGSAAAGPFTKINSTVDTSTVYTDNSVNSGQTYYYATTSVDSSGVESKYSNVAQAIVP